jgi:hypothetical protein
MSGLVGNYLQSLSAEQRRQRNDALQAAARQPVGRSVDQTYAANTQQAASRSSGGTAAAPTRAKYVNRGTATNDRGQTCTKVQETITLPDGKTGTSEQLVCPA